ncbi:hypothetical protein QAD02_012084 [Eretmocerus hayati]|uniref:Uncharacterized protein n=1 Tax=Eretmocerus hayati TaxID=131215 RepID=A0ACC2NYW0_9HYME|nr:hypothetical protein QAD02_012084 [Eretmocerus hayati]
MSPKKSTPMLMLITLICMVMASHAFDTNSFSRWINYDPESLLVGFTLQKTNLSYILCKNEGDYSEETCSLIIETNPSNDTSTVRSATCDFPLKPEKGYELGTVTNISPITNNRTFVGWSENSRLNQTVLLKFFLIDSENCTIITNKISLGSSYLGKIFILTSNKSFEVVYEAKSICKNMCSEIFTSGGKKISGPADFDLSNQTTTKVLLPTEVDDDLSGIGGCFAFKSEERLNASLIFTEIFRSTFGLKQNGSQRAGVSTAHGILSVCKRVTSDKKSLNCSQGDLKNWVKLSFDHEPQNSMIYSLREKGYLVMTSHLSKSLKKNRKTSFVFFLTAFDHQGHEMTRLEITKLGCYGGLSLLHGQFFESESDEYCISLLEHSAEHFHLFSRCLPKELLLPSSTSSTLPASVR